MTKPPSLSKDILQLTKAEIVLLEAITLVAGFFIGQPIDQPIDWVKFIFSLLGVSALALGSGALNQIQERQEDSQMNRTKLRPLPSGRISFTFACVLVIFLFAAGVFFLHLVSPSVLALGIFAVISYNGLYTMWWKRKMAFAAIPGAIPGALPILIGFETAVNNLHDVRGYYLFAILFFWQMPLFWMPMRL